MGDQPPCFQALLKYEEDVRNKSPSPLTYYHVTVHYRACVPFWRALCFGHVWIQDTGLTDSCCVQVRLIPRPTKMLPLFLVSGLAIFALETQQPWQDLDISQWDKERESTLALALLGLLPL